MKVRGRYGWLTLFGVPSSDEPRIRLGRAQSFHVARGIALSILRATSKWRHIDIESQTGKIVGRVHRPAMERNPELKG
jgi:hypothetical protein